jgi:hypothetical protein
VWHSDEVIRSFLLFLAATLLARASGSLDPAFERVPFDQWLSEHAHGPFRWTVANPRAEMSFHQRLVAPLDVKVDGRDLENRRDDGELVFFFQVTAPDGTRYQDHSSVDLKKLDPNIKAADLQCIQHAFVLPGDYRLAVGVFDTRTKEHGATELQFRVPAQHSLPPGAWQGLPSVEFIGHEEPPDSYFLPAIQGHLQWAAAVHSPARLNVILNVAPSLPVPGAHRTYSGELAALLPTLKVFSETGSSSLSEHVELLDLARRRKAFEQDQVHDLDWPRLEASLGVSNTGSIDVHSLQERHHDAQFFLSEVRSVLRASEGSCTLVVLAAPVAFESGEDLEPISREALPACSVFYIRYHEPRQRPVGPHDPRMDRGRYGRFGNGPLQNRLPLEVPDQLEGTLKPLSPKVYDVQTPDEVAKALSDIVKSLR